jgi:light-regulated signal transduction histidine kinase (bacteriophytochrome)
MHIAIVPIADSNGQATHFISIGRDVTERLENIEAIREQNKKLKDIAWVQSHDVRGPLARIKGLVNLLNIHSRPDEDAELIGYLKSASNEMDDVIKKIVKETEEIYGFIK